MKQEDPSEDLPERISKEAVNALPSLAFQGEVEVISRDRDVPRAMQLLGKATELGFDTETKPIFRRQDAERTPALLQLSTETHCFLFQLKRLKQPELCFEILSNPDIRKIGVAIRDDLRQLQAIHPFDPKNVEDLSQVASRLGIVTVGLRNLTAIFLGGKLSKKARLSNWEAAKLSPDQIRYAATDAWVSLKLHAVLKKKLAESPISALPEAKPPARIDHLNLVVAEMERSMSFYTELLGFEKTLDCILEGSWFEDLTGFNGARARCVYLELSGQTRLELLEFIEPKSPKEKKNRRKDPTRVGFRHFAVEVKDIFEAKARLEQAGISFRGDPVEVPLEEVTGKTGRKRLCYFHGPDGEIVEIADYTPVKRKRSRKRKRPASPD